MIQIRRFSSLLKILRFIILTSKQAETHFKNVDAQQGSLKRPRTSDWSPWNQRITNSHVKSKRRNNQFWVTILTFFKPFLHEICESVSQNAPHFRREIFLKNSHIKTSKSARILRWLKKIRKTNGNFSAFPRKNNRNWKKIGRALESTAIWEIAEKLQLQCVLTSEIDGTNEGNRHSKSVKLPDCNSIRDCASWLQRVNVNERSSKPVIAECQACDSFAPCYCDPINLPASDSNLHNYNDEYKLNYAELQFKPLGQNAL